MYASCFKAQVTLVATKALHERTSKTRKSEKFTKTLRGGRSHPAYVGADAHDEVQAHLVGVVAGLEALAARGDTAPLLLRLSDPAAGRPGAWGS